MLRLLDPVKACWCSSWQCACACAVLWAVWRRWDWCPGQRRVGGLHRARQRPPAGHRQRVLQTQREGVGPRGFDLGKHFHDSKWINRFIVSEYVMHSFLYLDQHYNALIMSCRALTCLSDSVCLSAFQSVWLCVCVLGSLAVYLSFWLTYWLSSRLSVCLSVSGTRNQTTWVLGASPPWERRKRTMKRSKRWRPSSSRPPPRSGTVRQSSVSRVGMATIQTPKQCHKQSNIGVPCLQDWVQKACLIRGWLAQQLGIGDVRKNRSIELILSWHQS